MTRRRNVAIRTGVVLVWLLAALAGAGIARAAWADSEPISRQRLTTGRVGLTANGSATAAIGPITITPSFAGPVTQHFPVTIANVGNVGLTYQLDNITAAAPTNALFTTGLTVRVSKVTGSAACTGTNPGTTIIAAGSALPTATFALRPPLPPAGSEFLCFSLTIPLATNALFREGSVALTLHFHGQSL